LTSVIIGATSVEQLKIDISASEVTLSAEVLADIEKVYRSHPRPL
jgi:aryl-alcohol dehydrogenase-like predicted oxidoreductase